MGPAKEPAACERYQTVSRSGRDFVAPVCLLKIQMPKNPNAHGESAVPQPSAESLVCAIVDTSDDALNSKTLDGVITSWNQSAERIFGYAKAEALGRSISMLIPPERLAEEDEIIARVKRGERVDHFETVRRQKDGGLIDVAVTISPVRMEDGTIVGASKIARDITEQKRSGRADLLLAAIVMSSDDAIVSKNLDGVITSWNQGAERIFGYTADEAVGRPVLMLVPADRKHEEPQILERLRRGERIDHFETIRVRKSGEVFPVSLTISPVRNARGDIVGASKIARDISELKRIYAEREQLLESERAARSQAERANRMKDEFLATVSHELRTPLNAIVGWTQVLKEGDVSTDDVAQGIEVIDRSARIQAQLIDDLLDLGRITSGKMTLDVQWLDLGRVVREAIASVVHAATAKQIKIKTIIDHSGGGMMGDHQRLQQVIWNLLSNAIKFTPKNGVVIITVRRVNSHVELSVCDNGRGIEADFLPHVFERFRQADASTTRQFGGLGIGLALVRELVELHGGLVQAESAGSGQGSTFIVSLPVVATRFEPVKPKEDRSREADDAMNSSENLAGTKVLVVDDDQDSLNVVTRILTHRQADVRAAASVDEALEILVSFHPDVILSDIGMPERDGYELIHRVRQLEGGRSVPAAALTALARSEDRMRALKAGFQTHVTKPVAPAELIAVVRSLAALQRQPVM
jgi:PAS domain S-box-containing protein